MAQGWILWPAWVVACGVVVGVAVDDGEAGGKVVADDAEEIGTWEGRGEDLVRTRDGSGTWERGVGAR